MEALWSPFLSLAQKQSVKLRKIYIEEKLPDKDRRRYEKNFEGEDIEDVDDGENGHGDQPYSLLWLTYPERIFITLMKR